MKRNYINSFLIIMALAIVGIILRDVIAEKAGKNKENPYKYDLAPYQKVDTTAVLYHETTGFAISNPNLRDIAVKGNIILVLCEDSLLQYDYQGKCLTRFATGDSASCIAPVISDTIWIGMLHKVTAFNLQGKRLLEHKPLNERSVITSIAVAGEKLFVADAGNRIVYQMNREGSEMTKIGQKDEHLGIPGYILPSAYFDLAMDREGFLWAANTGRHSLESYTTDGAMRKSWGHASTQMDGFFGCCNPAHFTLLSDGSFITSEKGIPRIKRYDKDGVFKGVVAPPASFENGWYAPEVIADKEGRVIALDFDKARVRIFETNP